MPRVQGVRPDVERQIDDPIEAFGSPDIHTRAAAARHLSLHGTHEHVPLLVDKARSDPSPAVRLISAGAAADILSRHRVGPRRDEVSEERRRELLDCFRGLDPGVNPGLFTMLACIGLREGVQRILAGLHDPRGGVRLGAGVGLVRLVTSLEAFGDAQLERAVVAKLRDHRVKPDALAEVARACAAAGWTSALPAMRALDLPGAHGEVVADAIAVLARAGEPPEGAWWADGLDAGEVNPEPPLPRAVLVASGGRAVLRERGGEWRVLDPFPAGPVRRMFFRRVGEHRPGPAFQDGERTWYAATPPRLCEEIEAGIDPLAVEPTERPTPGAALAAELVPPLLPGGAAGFRVRAVLLAEGGRLEEAVEAARAARDAARGVGPRAEMGVLLGRCLAALGRAEEARAAWRAVVEAAPRSRHPAVRAAAALLDPSG